MAKPSDNPVTPTPSARETPQKRRPRRWRKRILLVLATVLVFLFAACFVLLETPYGRDQISRRVIAKIETGTGLQVRLGRWDIGLTRGRLVVQNLEVFTPEAELLASIERLEVVVAVRSLLGPHVRIPSVLVEAPFVDLNHLDSLPTGQEQDAAPTERTLAAESIEIRNGRVRGTPQAVDLGQGPASVDWTVEALALEGSVSTRPEGSLALSMQGDIVATGEPLFDPRLHFEVAASGSMDTLRIDSSTVTGDGVDIQATGQFSPGADQSSRLEFETRIDPARLLRIAAKDSRLIASGEVNLGESSATVQATAFRVPISLLTGTAGDPFELDATLDFTSNANDEDVLLKSTGSVRSGAQTLATFDFNAEGQRKPDDEGASSWVDAQSLAAKGSVVASQLPIASLRGLLPKQIRQQLDAMKLGRGIATVNSAFTVSPGQQNATATVNAEFKGSDASRLQLKTDEVRINIVDGAPDFATLGGGFSLRAEAVDPGSLGQLVATVRPGELEGLLQDLAQADDRMDVEVTGSVRGMSLEPGSQARISWTLAEGTRLFEAGVDVRSGSADAALKAEFDVRLLSSRTGAREITAVIELPSRQDLSLASITSGQLLINEPTLETLLDQLRQRFPNTLEKLEHPALTGLANLNLSATGKALDPEVAGSFSWQPTGAPQGWLDGQIAARPAARAGSLKATFDIADLGQLEQLGFLAVPEGDEEQMPWGGEFHATLDVSATDGPDGSELAAQLDATARPVRIPGVPALDTASLRAELSQGSFWRKDGINIPGLIIEELSLGGPQGRATLTGTLTPPGTRNPAPEAELKLEGTMPEFQVTTVTDITLIEARLRAVSRQLESASGSGSFEAELGLGALYGVAGLATFEETLRSWGIAPQPEPATIRMSLPDFQIASGNGPVGPPTPGTSPPLPTWTAHAKGLVANLEIDLQTPSSSEANLQLQAAEFTQGATPIRLAEPLNLVLRNHRVTLSSTSFNVGEETLGVEAQAQLGPWDASQPQSLVESIKAQARGTIDTAFLTPFLAGGTAVGPAELQLVAEGNLEALTANIALQAPGASFQFTSPYATKIDGLELKAQLNGGSLILESAHAQLNRGTVEVQGVANPKGDLDLTVNLTDVRYRIDYGLSTQISGALALNMPLGDELMTRGRLSGDVVLERGLLRRNINLEREALAILMPQSTALSADDPFARAFELDLTVATRKGVRVRNNVADMRLFWSPLRVRGSLAEPLIDGVLDAEPGGLITAYGQTVRLDQATVTLRGQPGAQPSLDLVTTTSLEDPSVVRRSGRGDLDPFAAPADPDDQTTATDRAAGGLAQYVGERLLGGGSGGLRIGNAFSVRPIIVLTETEPSARLLVSRRLSEQLDLGAALDMRSAEDRTYLIDVHDVPWLPSLSGQVFVNEDRQEGVTVQQVLELGGGPTDQRRVGKVRIKTSSPGPSTKFLQGAAGIERGDPWADDLEFDVEIDIEEALRRRGYPSPTVRVSVNERGMRHDLQVEVEAGTAATFEFAGIKIPRKLREPLRWIYRTDFYETASLRELEEQTQRALLGEGWLSPKVQAIATREVDGTRRVVVTSESNVQIADPQLVADHLPIEAQVVASRTLDGRGAIATLLSDDEGAIKTLEGRFQRAGWATARFLDFELEADGEGARLEIELGARTQIGEITVLGAPPELLPQAEEVTIKTGSPYDQNSTTAYAAQIETGLRDRGYRNARVDIEPTVSGTTAKLVYRVDTGLQFRVGQVNVVGGRNTNQEWVSKVALIEEGDVLDTKLLSQSRRRLLSTGLFDTIYLETTKLENGEIEIDVQLEEQERWSLGYGLRWESAEGLGAVVDIRDQNFLGRGVQFGARALYTEDRESFRLYSSVPRVLGSGFSVETYAELRNENDEGLLIDTVEASLQLSRPLSRFGTGRVYARYRDQMFSEEDPDPFFPLELEIRSPFLGIQYIWDNRADVLSGSTGLFASTDLSGSGDALGSDFDYLRFFGQVQLTRNAFRYGTKTATWAQSLRLGLADSGDDPLLRDLRFFAGGEYSVRGYRTESLGPIEDLGRIQRPLGGQALLVFNQELRLPVIPDLSTVFFFDAGEVWEQIDDLETRLRTSLGLGLRYRSPLGTLRLDVGFPLDRREGDPSYRAYFGLGQVF